MNKALMNLTKNKYVFYVVSLLAILNVLGYFSMRSWSCIVMFAAVAYSAKCYAKNNVLALLAGLFVANFVFGCNQVKENFEEAIDPASSALAAVKNMNKDLEKEEEACTQRGGVWEANACKGAMVDGGEAEDKLQNIVSTMKGMKGMESMEKVLGALTNMGK
jgi:hypothetical protein